jgi:hypothetical protein
MTIGDARPVPYDDALRFARVQDGMAIGEQ